MKKPIPYEFVLEEIASLEPYTKPMFGCLGVYSGEKILVILRRKEAGPEDNGLWLATFPEHHESLRRELPSMRSIQMFGGSTAWQVVPEDGPDFETEAFRVCELLRRRDPRIGKVPAGRKRPGTKKGKTAKAAKKPSRKKPAPQSPKKTKRVSRKK